MKLIIRPLTPDLWPALEDLFGKGGASNGCWCMYWRLGPNYHQQPRQKNKAALRRLLERGPPPGLLAFDSDLAVGWGQPTPRDALPWLNRARLLQRVDAVPVWSLSCFYVRRGYRRRGHVGDDRGGSESRPARAKAPALEAYPVDTDAPKSTTNVFTGTRAGFKTVAGRVPARPIMRRDLTTSKR